VTPMRVRLSLGPEPVFGLPAMVGYSAFAHLVALIVLLVAPRVLPHKPPPPSILLGQIVSLPPPAGIPAGRPSAPAAAPTKPPEAVKPPAKSKAPEPPKEPEPPVRKKPAEVVPPEPGKEKPKKEEPKKPAPNTRGAGSTEEARPEPAPASTAPIPEGIGLATAGGEVGGIPSINSAAFPYDWYRTTMVNLIRSRWRRPVTPGLTQSLRCSVSFVISRGGGVSDVTLTSSSGFSTLDASAVRAVSDSNPLPQLPYQYTSDSIRADLVFELTPD